MSEDIATESPIKTVEVHKPYLGNRRYGSLSETIDETVRQHISEGWTLFSVNVINQAHTQGTGQPMAYISFIR